MVAPVVGSFGLGGSGHTGALQCRDWWLGSSSGNISGEAATAPSYARWRASGQWSDLSSAAAGLRALVQGTGGGSRLRGI